MHETIVHSSDVIDAILAKYKVLVYRLAYSKTGNRFDADDVFQEVFMRYIRSAPVFESEEHAKAWFLKVTVNCTKKYFLSSWKKRVVLLDDMDDMRKSYSIEAEMDSGIYAAVLKLPPKFRAVIHLFYYEELSIEQMSVALGARPSTVRTWLTRARQQLKKTVQKGIGIQMIGIRIINITEANIALQF